MAEDATVWRMSVIVPEDAADLIEQALSGPDVTTSIFAVAGDIDLPDDADPINWQVEAFSSNPPNRDDLIARLAAASLASGLVTVPDLIVEALEDRDWVAESEASHTPVEAGRFFVHGAHDRDKVPVDKIAIEIPAAQAFGTGGHETTHGCLLALQEILQAIATPSPDYRILDLGTGSGILAIAVALGFGYSVLASDLDPDSVDWTIRNAEDNGVGDKITARLATGFEHEDIHQNAPYDLIIANILANPLIKLAPDMAMHARPGGQIILAGLLLSQADSVIGAYEKVGFNLQSRLDQGEWSILTLSN